MNFLLLPAYLALVAFVVYRQFASQRIGVRSLLLIPGLLAVGAVETLGKASLGPMDIATLAVGAALGLGLGLWRGWTYRVWLEADGSAWQRGTLLTLVNWLILIVLRVGVGAGAHFAGVGNSQMIGEMLASLFVTFAAQGVVLWLRSQSIQGLLPASVR